MIDRMTDASPKSEDLDNGSSATTLPSVRVVVASVEGADVDAALASIRRQAYDGPVDVTVLTDDPPPDADYETADSFETAVAGTDSSVEYLWILHADARPRPDALKSLVREVDRHDAGLGASKLLKAGTRDVLESIGSATDVFGEPYTGLDDDEVDLQQYDVVREVSFVTSVSMLVRRDLARGLGGLDPILPPDAAGQDFSQRARLAGGRVIIVPSSEVYHQSRCRIAHHGWNERAGRLRAMLKAYSPLTLIWMVPLYLLVGLLDSILNLFLLRWQHLASFLGAIGWNLLHLPSTVSGRRRTNKIRHVGDEELFRFQTSGSVRLRSVGEELSARVLSMFDDDQALTRGAKRVWSSPGIVGALVAVVVAVVAARSLLFSGVPNAGLNFAFEPPSQALGRYLGGWNETGLGSPAPVHPLVGFTGLTSLLWFGTEGAARTLLTVGLGVIAIAGMGRLLGRLGLRGPGRYLAGIVCLAGPGTALLVGLGSWSALAAAAFLPWAIRAVFVHPAEEARSSYAAFGFALVAGWITASVSPALMVVPLIAALLWWLQGGRRSRVLLAIATLAGGLASLNFISGDPGWLFDETRRNGLDVGLLWPGLILVAALPLFLGASRDRRVAGTGGLLSLGAILVVLSGLGGPGIEEAALVTASAGAAVVVGVSLDRFSFSPLPAISLLAASAMLVLSVVGIFGGTYGLPRGDRNDELSFAISLADDGQPRRILYASGERADVPGESRPGPGFWYRVLDGTGTTNDEVWLPEMRAGDFKLEGALTDIASGGSLRPGDKISEFGIGWIVLDGPPNALDSALASQLDVVPLPLGDDIRVFEVPGADPLAVADNGDLWSRDGLGWTGDAGTGRVALAQNYTTNWQPEGGQVDWYTSVAASSGQATYGGHTLNRVLGLGSVGLLLLGVGLVIAGRRKP